MEKLYYKNQYIKEFITEILEIIEKDNKYHILLEDTYFFPGGGGQFCDLGKIDIHRVIDVYEKDKKIYHVVDTKPIKIHKVRCSIDWDRREDGMHQHLGQHVLSGCFYSLFKANTVGFHLGKEISTVDIEGVISKEQIQEAERLANDIINQNIKIDILCPSKKELKKIWIRRDLPNTDEQIRIVKIGELDSNACCGVHPNSTLELRLIKIRKSEKSRGATRLEYVAGKRAIEQVLKRDGYMNDICKYLKSTDEEAIKGIEGLHIKLEDSLSENKRLEELVSEFEIKEMINNAIKIGNISIVKMIYENKSSKYISKLASKITNLDNVVSLIGVKIDDKINLSFSCSTNIDNLNMNTLLKDSIKLVDGNGGGSKFLAQGGGKNNGNLESTLEYALNKIERCL